MSQKREEEEIGGAMDATNTTLIMRLMGRLSRGGIAAVMVTTGMQVVQVEEEAK